MSSRFQNLNAKREKMKKNYTIGSITRIGLWIVNENDAWLVIRTKEGWEYGIKKEEVDK